LAGLLADDLVGCWDVWRAVRLVRRRAGSTVHQKAVLLAEKMAVLTVGKKASPTAERLAFHWAVQLGDWMAVKRVY